MDNSYISSIPIPACVVDKDGIVSAANPLMKNVFVYEDIVGNKFFTLTGVKREQLLTANEEEIIVDRNDKFFKLIAYYDNEYGYATKVLELIRHMYSVDHKE